MLALIVWKVSTFFPLLKLITCSFPPLIYITVFENHRKSLIQHCVRSEVGLHFEWTKVDKKWQKSSIWSWNLRSNSVTRQVNFDRTKNGGISKCDILGNFQTLCMYITKLFLKVLKCRPSVLRIIIPNLPNRIGPSITKGHIYPIYLLVHGILYQWGY